MVFGDVLPFLVVDGDATKLNKLVSHGMEEQHMLSFCSASLCNYDRGKSWIRTLYRKGLAEPIVNPKRTLCLETLLFER